MTAASEALSDVNGYGLLAARPAAGIAGRLYFGSDTSLVYRDDGSSWTTVLTGSTGLTVEEVDGSPTNAGITKIVFPNGTLGIVGTVATYTPSVGGGGDLVRLGSPVVLAVDTAAITFTGISQSYRDLIVIFKGRSARNALDDFMWRVGNGSIDSGGHYAYYTNYSGSTSGTANANNSGSAYAGPGPGINAGSGIFMAGEVILFDYTSSTPKQMQVRTSYYESTVFVVQNFGSAGWTQTSAIDQFTVFPANGNFKAGSLATLYGRT